MKHLVVAAGLTALVAAPSVAETIGVSMARFDDSFLTALREGMIEQAGAMTGIELRVEDAGDDAARQLGQVAAFAAAGLDAIIVNAVDTSATPAMSAAAAAAGVPLVYVNRQPVNVETLPETQAYVGSDEVESGTLAAFEGCRLLRAAGLSSGARGYMLTGQPSNHAAIQRARDVHDVLATDMCGFITLIDARTANWSHDEARAQMTRWLASGEQFDILFGGNDEMALGAVEAIKAAGLSLDDVIVTGVDATPDALRAMATGDLDVTVFQDAAGQGAAALDAALRLAAGERVPRAVYIPFQLVTPATMESFMVRH